MWYDQIEAQRKKNAKPLQATLASSQGATITLTRNPVQGRALQSGSSHVITFMANRVMRYDKNFIAIIAGGSGGSTGSGKSMCALRIGEKSSEVTGAEFTGDNVCFTTKQFTNIINSGLPRGSCVVYEEAGVSAGARDWQSEANKTLSKISQTMRHQNHIVLFTVPNLDFVDNHLRKLAHCLITTEGIMLEEKLCRTKFALIRNNGKASRYTSHDIPTQYIRIMNEEAKHVLKDVYFRLPSTKLRNDYLRKKQQFNTLLNKASSYLSDGTGETQT